VTPLHRLLQALLGLPVPVWHHHQLIRDEAGRRLAKRDDARALAALRAQGATPEDVRRTLGIGPARR
jgi:glutamyl-Q tRNA(Asp) synthetase